MATKSLGTPPVTEISSIAKSEVTSLNSTVTAISPFVGLAVTEFIATVGFSVSTL